MKPLFLTPSLIYARPCHTWYGHSEPQSVYLKTPFCKDVSGKTCCDRGDFERLEEVFDEAAGLALG